jgi:hypothetical protein
MPQFAALSAPKGIEGGLGVNVPVKGGGAEGCSAVVLFPHPLLYSHLIHGNIYMTVMSSAAVDKCAQLLCFPSCFVFLQLC